MPPGLYDMAVSAFDPLSADDVGLIGKTKIRTRVLTKNHVARVAAARAHRTKRGPCRFVASGGLLGMVCHGSTSGTLAQISHVFTIPAGGRATAYGLHYIRAGADEGPGRITYGHTLPGPNKVIVFVRLNGHRAVIITDLFVKYTTSVRQRPAVPRPSVVGVVVGPLDLRGARAVSLAGRVFPAGFDAWSGPGSGAGGVVPLTVVSRVS